MNMKHVFITISIVVAVSVFVVIAKHHTDSVDTRVSAGELISSTFHFGSFSNRTAIVTSKGTFAVHGAFQAITGNALVIQTRNDGRKYLCDELIGQCNKMAN